LPALAACEMIAETLAGAIRMSEPSIPPTSPPASVPQPFGSAPTPVLGGGCGKPVLLGCGVLFLLLGIAGVALLFKAKDLLSWSLGNMGPAVVGNVAADVPPEEVRRFEAALAAARQRIEAGQIDPQSLQRVQSRLLAAMSGGKGQLDRRQLQDLTVALEGLGGVGDKAAPPAAPQPAAPQPAAPQPAAPQPAAPQPATPQPATPAPAY
jgi:hypothetical protein